MRRLLRGVIRQALRDLINGDQSASRYLTGKTFQGDCEIAGYPQELCSTMEDVVLLSKVERESACAEILKMLSDMDDPEHDATYS